MLILIAVIAVAQLIGNVVWIVLSEKKWERKFKAVNGPTNEDLEAMYIDYCKGGLVNG